MGLLDDAIREHLDLKRRRGADPAEVERAEREALGPVRRGPERAADAELDDEYGADEEVEYPETGEHGREEMAAYDHQSEEEPWDDRFADEPEPGSRQARSYDEPEPEPPVPPSASFSPERAVDPEPFGAEEPFAGSPPRAAPPPHPADPASPLPREQRLSDETAEYNVEEALGEHPRKEGEDVLEETPEFLQDTPEHDRLWFEQRPTKDFDFEG